MGQRATIVAILTLVLLILGVALGNQPGAFPALAAADTATTITPNFIIDLIGQIVAPIILLLTMLAKLFGAINARIVAGDIKPGQFLELLKLPEFWTALVGAAVGVGEIYGVHILTPDQQVIVVNSLLGLFTVLFNSLAQRTIGASLPTAMIVEGKATTIRR